MLHGQMKQIVERDLLVAVDAGTVGEARKSLSFQDWLNQGLDEASANFELPAGLPCMGEPMMMALAASRVSAAVGQVAVGINRHQLGVRAIGHGLGHALGVAVAGDKPLQSKTWMNPSAREKDPRVTLGRWVE